MEGALFTLPSLFIHIYIVSRFRKKLIYIYDTKSVSKEMEPWEKELPSQVTKKADGM